MDVQCLPQSLSTLNIKAGRLTEARVTIVASLVAFWDYGQLLYWYWGSKLWSSFPIGPSPSIALLQAFFLTLRECFLIEEPTVMCSYGVQLGWQSASCPCLSFFIQRMLYPF